MSKLYEFQPGVFARSGERTVVDGNEYVFVSGGWSIVLAVDRVLPPGEMPPELRFRKAVPVSNHPNPKLYG